MDEKTILITEHNGTYQIQNNGIPEFALIGILECIVFDMKSVSRKTAGSRQKESLSGQDETNSRPLEKQNEAAQSLKETKETKETKIIEDSNEAEPTEPRSEAAQPAAPDLRTRISNAIKAIRGLGAQIEDTDLSNLTDEELQSELEELTGQYKRLKTSKGTNK